MSVNVIRTNKSFEEWYNNITSDRNEISICINYDEKIEWVFWFCKPLGGLCSPIHFLNIHPDDSRQIIGKIMSDEIESRIYIIEMVDFINAQLIYMQIKKYLIYHFYLLVLELKCI